MKIIFCTWPSAMTLRCHWHRRVRKDTSESILIHFLWLSFHLKKKSNQIQARVNYITQGLWGKSLKNRGCLSVPDKRIRNIPEVVLVRRWVSWGSGNSEGEGWVGGLGQRRVSLQATWDRGGRFLSQLGGFQVSRRVHKGGERGIGKGRLKQGEMRHV